MFKVGKLRNLAEANKANLHYQRGDEAWQRGQLRPAFRHFLAAARAGMAPAFRVVGQFYERGSGVGRNERAALRWYGLAARDGDPSAANNIGCIWRDRGQIARALRWFERAVKLGDADANLNIAEVYLRKHNADGARAYLNRTRRSPWATEQSKEQAAILLKELKVARPKHKKRRSPRRRARA